MITPPEIVDSPAQLIAFIHVTVSRDGIMQAMQTGLAELTAALKEQNVPPAGPWFSWHLRRPSETFDFRICFPVSTPIAPTQRVEAGELPASKVARTVYNGNYSGLAAAWGRFVDWVNQNNYTTREDFWERYILTPDNSAEPEEYRTELNRPLA